MVLAYLLDAVYSRPSWRQSRETAFFGRGLVRNQAEWLRHRRGTCKFGVSHRFARSPTLLHGTMPRCGIGLQTTVTVVISTSPVPTPEPLKSRGGHLPQPHQDMPMCCRHGGPALLQMPRPRPSTMPM